MTIDEELANLDAFYGMGRYAVTPTEGERMVAKYGRLPHGVEVHKPIPFTRVMPAPAARPFGGAHWKQRR